MAAPLRRASLLPLALLALMLALLATSTAARADDPKLGHTTNNTGIDIPSELAQHPVLGQPCKDGAICIAGHYPPLAPAETISITGYTPHGKAEQVWLTITDPDTGRVLYAAATTSEPMVGDYAGHSAFRFVVPASEISGLDRYAAVHAATATSVSNDVRVWSYPWTY